MTGSKELNLLYSCLDRGPVPSLYSEICQVLKTGAQHSFPCTRTRPYFKTGAYFCVVAVYCKSLDDICNSYPPNLLLPAKRSSFALLCFRKLSNNAVCWLEMPYFLRSWTKLNEISVPRLKNVSNCTYDDDYSHISLFFL